MKCLLNHEQLFWLLNQYYIFQLSFTENKTAELNYSVSQGDVSLLWGTTSLKKRKSMLNLK